MLDAGHKRDLLRGARRMGLPGVRHLRQAPPSSKAIMVERSGTSTSTLCSYLSRDRRSPSIQPLSSHSRSPARHTARLVRSGRHPAISCSCIGATARDFPTHAVSHDQAARRVARQSQARPQKIRAGCREWCVCVKRRVTHAERQRCLPLPRGVLPWRTRREMMDPLSALCARRCRPQTALGTRKLLRQWVRRCPGRGETFKKVCSPPLAQALPFLDAPVQPATSQVGERGNRRHCQRHKRVSWGRSTVC
jgi:hypothetical protein